MMQSPLALLRGAAPLFFEVLADNPALAEGPAGEGWLTGDAHLENFGAYRAGALSTEEARPPHLSDPVAFDLNDFDEAIVGPWRLDLLRLVTSLALGAREAGAGGADTITLCESMIDAYVDAAFGKRRARVAPAPVAAMLAKVRDRTRKQLLEARTEIVRGQRRFVRGEHFEDLPRKLRAKAERAFEKYAVRLPKAEGPPPEALEVLDAAFRVAGTGSLGGLRVALLVRGKGGVDGAWIFDMKAEGPPSAARLGRPYKGEPAERVCTAMRKCLARPPRMMGETRMRGQSMFVRRLMPQEDKIDFTQLESADLAPVARYLGALLGAAHRRGVTRQPGSPWADKDRARLLARAIALAGLHEGMYLAYCDLVRR